MEVGMNRGMRAQTEVDTAANNDKKEARGRFFF
jgi:hypothetical protein